MPEPIPSSTRPQQPLGLQPAMLRATALEPEPEHPKPLLTVEQQIDHMKSKGITFDLVSEAEAAEHLRTKCQFFRVYAYRKLFEKRVGGKLDGQYVGLDFVHLKALSNLDRKLRDTLLPMTLDVEHFAKIRLLTSAETRGEDGYAVIRDYRKSLPESSLKHLDAELDRRQSDPYGSDLVRKYRNDMPLWVLLEVVSFRTFLGITRYCAERWEDAELSELQFLLLRAKSVRNFCAHGACSLNDLTGSGPCRERMPVSLARAMTDLGISKRLRAKRLASPHMVQICTLIYVYATLVPEGRSRRERADSLRDLFSCADRELSSFPPQNPARAAVTFLERLTRSLGLLE